MAPTGAGLLKHIPGFSLGQIKLAVGRLRTFGKGYARELRKSKHAILNWIRLQYKNDPEAFWNDWKWLRLTVDLQVRLFVEAVLWERRGPWRAMITGFGPGRMKKGSNIKRKTTTGPPERGRVR